MSLNVKVKKLDPKAVVPQYATTGAAALDLTAVSEKLVTENGVAYVEYGTGLSFEIPAGHVGLIFPRSSISSNTTLVLANSVGVIDSDFRGEVKFRFKTLVPVASKKYKVGERVGQIMILPYPAVTLEEVQELGDTDRDNSGFGSTGK